MLAFLHIAGGAALVLYGVRLLRKGLDRLFGARLAQWLQRVSSRRLRGALVGILVAIVAPSSMTISLLGVDMVKAGSIGFANLWAIMLGSAIGLTVMVQLIALDLNREAVLLVLAGVILFQGVRHNAARGAGQVLLGLGFILIAIGFIRDSSGDIRGSEDLGALVDSLARFPWGLALLAAIAAVLLQSGTATMGLLLGLTDGELIGLDVALPCVVGVNIGLGLTQMLFGFGHPAGRRLGLAMLASRFSIAVIIISLMRWLSPVLEWFSADPGRQIANAHSGFSLLMAIIWLPLVPVASRVIEIIVPDRPGDDSDPARPRFLRDDYTESPALAFGQSLKEIIRMAEIVRGMLQDVWSALRDRNLKLCGEIQKRDDVVDALDQAIKAYLTRLGGEDYGPRESATQVAHLRYIGELEAIGDIIDKNLVELVRKTIRTGGYFSDEGYKELRQACDMVMENFAIADTAFATQDADLAEQLIRHKTHLAALDLALRRKHFDRLQKGMSESVETSSIHLDMLTYLKTINSHLTAVAYPILDQVGRPHPDTSSPQERQPRTDGAIAARDLDSDG